MHPGITKTTSGRLFLTSVHLCLVPGFQALLVEYLPKRHDFRLQLDDGVRRSVGAERRRRLRRETLHLLQAVLDSPELLLGQVRVALAVQQGGHVAAQGGQVRLGVKLKIG